MGCRDKPGNDKYGEVASLKPELFSQNSFGEAVAGIEEDVGRALAILGDHHLAHMADFHMISNSGHGALVCIQHGDRDLGLMGKDGAPPAARPEGADGSQCQKGRIYRQDWSVCGEIIGGAASGRGEQYAITDQLLKPRLVIYGDAKLRCLIALAKEGNLIERETLMGLSSFVGCQHFQGMNAGEFGGLKSLQQMIVIIVIEQKTNGTPVHAVDRNTGGDEAMQGLKHMPVAAQDHHHAGLSRICVAMVLYQPGEGFAGLGRVRGEEGDAVEFHAGFIGLTGGRIAYIEDALVSNP